MEIFVSIVLSANGMDGNVPRKNQTFSRILQIRQDALQMWRWVQVPCRVVGNNSVKVARDVSIPNHAKNISNHVIGAKVNVSIFEELNGIRNQTTFRHAKEIIQGFEATLSLSWSEGPLSTIFLVDARRRHFLPAFPGDCHFVCIGKMTNPSSLLVHGKPANTKAWVKLEPNVQHFHRIVSIMNQTFQCHIVNQLQEFLGVGDEGVIVIFGIGKSLMGVSFHASRCRVYFLGLTKSNRSYLSKVHVRIGKDGIVGTTFLFR
jgi:hypothetical protein